MTETLAHGYSSERTQRELSNEYQYDKVSMIFQKSFHPCVLDERNLSMIIFPFHKSMKSMNRTCPINTSQDIHISVISRKSLEVRSFSLFCRFFRSLETFLMMPKPSLSWNKLYRNSRGWMFW